MANVRLANTVYLDTASTLVVDTINTKVAGIIFTSDNVGDVLELAESSTSGLKLTIKAKDADKTDYYDFSDNKLVFSQGIYVTTLTSGAKATLVLG
jgi:hypothetical protein